MPRLTATAYKILQEAVFIDKRQEYRRTNQPN